MHFCRETENLCIILTERSMQLIWPTSLNWILWQRKQWCTACRTNIQIQCLSKMTTLVFVHVCLMIFINGNNNVFLAWANSTHIHFQRHTSPPAYITTDLYLSIDVDSNLLQMFVIFLTGLTSISTLYLTFQMCSPCTMESSIILDLDFETHVCTYF